MKVSPTVFGGVFLVNFGHNRDERGCFSRVFCEDGFAREGLHSSWSQISTASNARAGTLRGLHWQGPPASEIKLIACLRGNLWDCLVDLRGDSPTFGRWAAFELSGESGEMLYVPAGIAHGYQTLEDGTDLLYLISSPHSVEHSKGVRWDDPTLGISWPREVVIMSERDRNLPRWDGTDFSGMEVSP